MLEAPVSESWREKTGDDREPRHHGDIDDDEPNEFAHRHPYPDLSRRGRDLNPRRVSPRALSRRLHSAALPPRPTAHNGSHQGARVKHAPHKPKSAN